MILKLKLFFVFIWFSTISNLIMANNPCEWWDFCLDSSVSYDLFAQWLGDVDASSRVAVRNHLKKQAYDTILDIPCGLCTDYFGLKKDTINILYKGMDYSIKLVQKAQKNNIDVKQGDIENIDHPENSFDVIYCRHILEHLKHYNKAMDEVIRIAKKEVIIVFFIKPSMDEDDFINLVFLNGHSVYHNRYSQKKFIQYVLSREKVREIFWENIEGNEIIAHILLKNEN